MGAHGVMFHHFLGGDHPRIQGATTRDEFVRMLAVLRGVGLLSADEWREKALAGRLAPTDVCLTFDDNLRSQVDIALPVLAERGLKAFWFPYTAPIVGEIETLEIYRYFRNTAFEDIDHFYRAFDDAVLASLWADAVAAGLETFDGATYLRDFPFYSEADRRFRFMRDRLLGPDAYREIMDSLLSARGFDVASAASAIWYDAEAVGRLAADGHVIGLHSHSHPTNLGQLDEARQREEYGTCREILEGLIARRIDVMSHPNGSYDERTLRVLAAMDMKIGFRSNMAMRDHGPFEYPRLDHSVLLKMLES